MFPMTPDAYREHADSQAKRLLAAHETTTAWALQQLDVASTAAQHAANTTKMAMQGTLKTSQALAGIMLETTEPAETA